jgi:hypothetical protein
MTIPALIKTLRELDRITSESSPGGESERPARDPAIRELDHRHSDGIDVRLLWSPADDRVQVAVLDAKRGEKFAIAVEPHEALTAFHHPYSYAASNGGLEHTLAV